MILFLTVLSSFLLGHVYVKGECPLINEIPVMNEENTNFVCAVRWHGKGSVAAISGCNECDGHKSTTIMKGDDDDHNGDEWCPAGSIIVKAGCTLYGWEGLGYAGKLNTFQGPNVYPDGCVVTDNWDTCPKWCAHDDCGCWGHGPRSLKCRCQQEPIICVPEDGYERVIQCDNSRGQTTVTCTYTKKIGTTYTDEVSNSMHIDISIEYAMTAAFFKFFSETLGVSVNTGYDWTQVSSETQSEEHDYTVSSPVPPGMILTVDAAIGKCGGNVAKTELFVIATHDANGNLEQKIYERTLADGTTIVF